MNPALITTAITAALSILDWVKASNAATSGPSIDPEVDAARQALAMALAKQAQQIAENPPSE